MFGSILLPIATKFDDSGLRKAKREFGKIGGSLKSALGSVGLGLSIAGVTQFLGSAITQASDLNEQGAAVGQIFGKGAKAIQDFASGAAKSLGQSTVQILEASKAFGVFGKAAGLGDKANADFSTSLVQLATDLASFNNTSVDDAITALAAGLRGESEPLRRYGVLLDDATLRQEALAMGIIRTTKKALTPQQRVLAANSVIFKQTKIQQGDFARTSGGLANQQRILTAQFANMKATLGQALIPTMTKFVGIASQFLDDLNDPKTDAGRMFKAIKAAVKDAFADVKAFFAMFGNGDAMKGFTNLVRQLVLALPALAAIKGIMTLAAAGKAIGNLVLAMKAMTVAGGGGATGAVVGGKGGGGLNSLPLFLSRAGGTVTTVLLLGGDTQKNKKIATDLVQTGKVESGAFARSVQPQIVINSYGNTPDEFFRLVKKAVDKNNLVNGKKP